MAKSFLELCQTGTKEEVEQALLAGADPAETDAVDRTTLMLAVLYNPEISVATVLLEYGVPVNALDASDMSALHYTVEYSLDKRFAELLILAGADVNSISVYNRSVLMSAAAFNHPCVELLLTAGADPLLVDEQGLDAVMYNVWFCYESQIVDCLFQAGASKEHRDNYNRDWQDYVRLCEPRFRFLGKPDLKPVRVDLEPALTLTEEQSDRLVTFGSSPKSEPFWVEHIEERGEYVIHYFLDKSESQITLKELPYDINHCVPLQFPSSWVLGSTREDVGEQEDDSSTVFVINESGEILHQFSGGYNIGEIISEETSFWLRYDEDPIYGTAPAPLVHWDINGSQLDSIDCEDDVTEDTSKMCVAACKDGDAIYTMFEPGVTLMKVEGEKVSFLETRQSYSSMIFNGNSCVMKELFRVDNILYRYQVVSGVLVLQKRLALYSEGKPVWDYDLHMQNNYTVFHYTNLFSITEH